MSDLQKPKCSLGLLARVKDLRNYVVNLSHEWDLKHNIPYTIDDEKEKLRIFNIPNPKTDFTNGNELKGIGDHLYPITKDLKKRKRIGSDTMWNRIPVSGYNRKYHEIVENKIKLDCWEEYCKKRGATLSYHVSDEIYNHIYQYQQLLVDMTLKNFAELKEMSPSFEE